MSNFLTISQIEAKIIAEFELLESLEKYEQLIEFAQNLPKMPENDKIPQNKIKSCQSRTWLVLTKDENPKTKTEQTSNSSLISDSDSDFANSFSKNNSKILSNSRLFFTGFSDSQLVGGLLQLLWRVYNGQNCTEILRTQLTFPKQIGLSELLTIGRQNGFWQIEKQIKNLAKSNLEK